MSNLRLKDTLNRMATEPAEPPKLHAFASVIPTSLMVTPHNKRQQRGDCSIAQNKPRLVCPVPRRHSEEKNKQAPMLPCTPLTENTTEVDFLRVLERKALAEEPEWKTEQKKSLMSLKDMFEQTFAVAQQVVAYSLT